MQLVAAVWLPALTMVLIGGMKSRHLGWPQAVLATGLMFWAVLIITAHILSMMTALGNTWLYVATSLIVALCVAAGMRMISPEPTPRPTEWPDRFDPRLAFHLSWLLVAGAAFVLLGNLVLAYGMLPANPDSIVYRFPRAYWYLAQGSLKHIGEGGDPRPIFYPFNATLAYLPLVHFRVDPRWFSLLSLLSWVAIGGTTYLFARDFGGNRLSAGATAWIVCLTPNVLLQALSGNDEIIAAAPMLAGLYFAHRWFLNRLPSDAVLASVGVGISIGTKLHPTFYWPFLVLIAIVLAFHWRAVRDEVHRWSNRRGMAIATVMATALIVFGLSFLGYNYLSSGRLMEWDFAAQVLNKPFSIKVALQTIVLFTSQIILTPIADLHIVFDTTARAHHYEAFNQLFAPLFTWVQNGPAYVSAFYRFTGVNTPSAVSFNEHTVFIGFTWIVVAVAALRLLTRSGLERTWGRYHLAALFIFFVTYASTTRYIEGCAVYLAYGVIVSGPALVYAFAPIASRKLDLARWVLLGIVVATHAFFAADIFLTSSPRNMITLARAAKASGLPTSRGFALDRSVQEEIERAQAGVFHRTIAWGQPYWAFMAYAPGVRHFFVSRRSSAQQQVPDADEATAILRISREGLMPKAGETGLFVYSFPKQPAWGRTAIRIPDKASAGLTWTGDLNFALGPEWVFAVGNGVEARFPNRDRYIVLTFNEVSDFGHDPKPILNIDPLVYGLGINDDLRFKYELRIDGRTVDRTEWSRLPSARLGTTGLKDDNGVLTISVRNDNAGGTVTSIDVALRSRAVPAEIGSEAPGGPSIR